MRDDKLVKVFLFLFSRHATSIEIVTWGSERISVRIDSILAVSVSEALPALFACKSLIAFG